MPALILALATVSPLVQFAIVLAFAVLAFAVLAIPGSWVPTLDADERTAAVNADADDRPTFVDLIPAHPDCRVARQYVVLAHGEPWTIHARSEREAAFYVRAARIVLGEPVTPEPYDVRPFLLDHVPE